MKLAIHEGQLLMDGASRTEIVITDQIQYDRNIELLALENNNIENLNNIIRETYRQLSEAKNNVLRYEYCIKECKKVVPVELDYKDYTVEEMLEMLGYKMVCMPDAIPICINYHMSNFLFTKDLVEITGRYRTELHANIDENSKTVIFSRIPVYTIKQWGSKEDRGTELLFIMVAITENSWYNIYWNPKSESYKIMEPRENPTVDNIRSILKAEWKFSKLVDENIHKEAITKLLIRQSIVR